MSQISNTWKHVRRSPYQTIAAVSILLLTLVAIGMFFLLSLGSSIVLKYFEQKPQIIVFFNDTKKEADIKSLEVKLKSSEKVAGVKYVSKEDALVIYKEQFKKDPLLLEMVSADILPASLEISTQKIEYLSEIANSLKQEENVLDIAYPEDVIKILSSWTNTVRYAGLFIVIFLTLNSLFTIMTVVSMKIALRKEEIEILQLVGASGRYIRTPFILEGIFYGLFGGIFGWLINIGILLYATPFLTNLFTGIPLFPIPIIFYPIYLVGIIFVGAILGASASLIAINRYLGK